MCVFGYYGISFISGILFEKNEHISNTNNPCKSSPYFEVFITTMSEIPGLIIGVCFIDKIGRKNMMLITFLVFGICCGLLSINNILAINGLALFLAFMARLNISLAFLCIYIYFSEYYPTQMRATALGFASSLGRIAGIMTSFIASDVKLNISMIFYSVSGFIAFLCILFVKDTTNKSMSDENNGIEMDDMSIKHDNVDDENL